MTSDEGGGEGWMGRGQGGLFAVGYRSEVL